MKKLLLIAAMAATVGAASAQTDVTPKNYHFNSAEKLNVFSSYQNGANIAAGGWESLKLAEAFDEGLIVLSGNGIAEGGNNHAAAQDMEKAMQLVDLGGTVGKVFCYADFGCNVNEGLKAATGNNYNIYECGVGHPWVNLNFYLDPKNTPTTAQGYMHVKITYNVYSKSFTDGTILGSVYAVTDQNGVRPVQSDGNASTPFDHQKNFTEDPMSEEMTYDPAKWIEYEWDIDCPESDAEMTYAPMRLKMNLGGNWNGAGQCIFIKDITITHIADTEKDLTANSGVRSYKEVSYEMGKPATTAVANVAAEAEALKVSVNGNAVCFNQDATVYTIAGVKAATAAATENVTLAPGFYVAAAGQQTVKFAVK